MPKMTYDAVLVRDGADGKRLVLFGAPATEVETWVGVPQRLMLGEDETVGFQRTVSPTRLDALAQFFANPNNVIQNPLLGAIRSKLGVSVDFIAQEGAPHLGKIQVQVDDEAAKTLQTLFAEVRLALEERDASLTARAFPETVYRELEARARDQAMALETQWEPSSAAALPGEEDETEDGADEDLDEPVEDEAGSEVTSRGVELAAAVEDALEETHISEFWDQLRAREKLAENLGAECPQDALFGFTREVLLSYLRPIILVDGQHRLAGAVKAAKLLAESRPDYRDRVRTLIAEGVNADDIQARLEREAARTLPMSVVLDDSPAEHVFQFVVVNQRATPVAKALLGTIVSTSLAAGELESIRERLSKASIEVEGSQIVAALARNDKSPFFNLIARGFDQDNANRIPWSVIGSLAEMFRTLKGGVFYHAPGVDYAASWAKHLLPTSKIVEDWKARGFATPLDYWRDPAGPWQPLFVAFWAAVRDKLSSGDASDYNYWGNPRFSNLFNKPSLTILQVDFFAYLMTTQVTLDSEADIKTQVDQWLRLVDKKYFARNWNLAGVKKDSVGTRRSWSQLWFNYRQVPDSLPAPAKYRALK